MTPWNLFVPSKFSIRSCIIRVVIFIVTDKVSAEDSAKRDECASSLCYEASSQIYKAGCKPKRFFDSRIDGRFYNTPKHRL